MTPAGPRNKAFAYNLRFHSKVPAQLGLPALSHDNLCEGIVVRPFTDVDSERIRIKIKNKEFSEIVEEDDRISHDRSYDIGFAISRINRHRVDSVRSHLGDDVDPNELAEAVIDDLFVDLFSSESSAICSALSSIDSDDRQAIREHIIRAYL